MDLNKLDTVSACEKGMEISINGADGIPTDIKINVLGVDSKTFKQGNATLQAKIKLAEKRGRELDPNDVETEYCQLMAKCTLGWTNLEENGKPVPFSVEKAQQIYESYPLIKSQVFVALLDREAFLGNSGGAS